MILPQTSTLSRMRTRPHRSRASLLPALACWFVITGAGSPAVGFTGPALSERAVETASVSWPEFRGPSRDGHASSAVPLTWSEESNVRWKTPIPGSGWSSPVAHDGIIWMTTATGEGRRLIVVAVDANSGKIIHKRTLFEIAEPAPKNDLNSYASPTPAVEAGRAYIHFGTSGTVCIDTTSFETVWQRTDLECDHEQGPGASPILFEDLVIFHMDGVDVQFVIALDKATGKTRWKTPRSIDLDGIAPTMRKGYSTPIIVDVDGSPRLISTAAQGTLAYDPRTGAEIWRLLHTGFSMSSRPIVASGLVILNTGYMRPKLIAVAADGEGEIDDSKVAWRYERSVPSMPSPIAIGDRIYLVHDSGSLTCLDASNGATLWRKRLGGKHCASPVYAGGRLYFFDRDGKTTVVAPGDTYDELAVNRLDDGFMASPAVLGNALILRTKTHLYRIEEAATQAADADEDQAAGDGKDQAAGAGKD